MAKSAASAVSEPSFAAPEGTYTQSHIVIPFAELPLAGHAPLVSNNVAGSSDSSTAYSLSVASPQVSEGGNTASVAPSSATSTAASGSQANPTTAALATPVTPMASLPPAWRKEVGSTVEPSISACSIPWTAAESSGAKRNAGQASHDVVQSGVAATDTSTESISSADPQNHHSQYSTDTRGFNAMSEPLIEGVLVSQGIDAPAASTSGGSGGVLGMSALTTYGFMPNSNQLMASLERQLSTMSDDMQHGPMALYKPSKSAAKPKNAVRQSSSSFVIKSQLHPDLKDILAQLERNACSTPSTPIPPMIFTQRSRTLLWLADGSGTKEPLARFLFASPPSSHDVNQLTRSPTTLDIIIGFPTGDIIWLDAIGLRYSRFNKGGIVTDSGITHIRWLPSASHEGLFVSAHADGTMIVWDREREDCEVSKGWQPRPWCLALTAAQKAQQMRLESETGAVENIESSKDLADNSTGSMAMHPRSLHSSRAPQTSERSNAASPAYGLNSTRTDRRWQGGSNSGGVTGTLSVLDWDPKTSIIVSRPGLVESEAGPNASGPGLNDPPSGMATPASHFSNSVSENGGNADVRQNLSGAGHGASAFSALGRSVGQRRRADSITQGTGTQSSIQGLPALALPDNEQQRSTSGPIWTKNPVTHWRVSNRRINSFAISPDLGCVAVVAEDALLRIIDLTTERLLATHASYFGSFLSLAWSPDGRFLLATSCDDLISIYHPRDSGTAMGGSGGQSESRLVARCVGHSSWVRDVAFDPYRWTDGDRTYRFGSVGEDGKLLLWDFSTAALTRPKHTTSTRRKRGTGAAQDSHDRSAARVRSNEGTSADLSDAGEVGDSIYHPAPPSAAVPQLNPVASLQVSTVTTILNIRFRPCSFILLHSNGVLQTFARPMAKVLRLGTAASNEEKDARPGSASFGDNAIQARAGADEKGKKGRPGGSSRGLSFGNTFSRGMKWVGGGSGSAAGTDELSSTSAGTQASAPHQSSTRPLANSSTIAMLG